MRRNQRGTTGAVIGMPKPSLARRNRRRCWRGATTNAAQLAPSLARRSRHQRGASDAAQPKLLLARRGATNAAQPKQSLASYNLAGVISDRSKTKWRRRPFLSSRLPPAASTGAVRRAWMLRCTIAGLPWRPSVPRMMPNVRHCDVFLNGRLSQPLYLIVI